jgi:hypothetical protein
MYYVMSLFSCEVHYHCMVRISICADDDDFFYLFAETKNRSQAPYIPLGRYGQKHPGGLEFWPESERKRGSEGNGQGGTAVP